MPTADTLTIDDNLQILMKGAFGTGKTIAACSWAVKGPVFLAYLDKKKPIELVNFYKKHRPDLLKRITYEVYGSHNVEQLFNELIKFQKQGCPYVAVVIDSVTYLTSAAVNWSMGYRATPKKDKDNPKNPQFIPDFDEYKVETSMVSQMSDICKTLPTTTIWIGHPLPTLKVEGSGRSMSVTKQTNIVSYGQKAGALVGGQFTEAYHFGRMVDKRIIYTDMVGDDYAKTCLNLPKEFDITDKLFYEVWKQLLDAKEAEEKEKIEESKPTIKEWTWTPPSAS